MKCYRIKEEFDAQRLILIFSGWSVDWHLFARYEYPEGYDVAVVWDYGNVSAELPEFVKDYEETVVIAWSFGVAAFQSVHRRLSHKLNVNYVIAVNGTTFPVDDERGIPVEVFAATKAGLSDAALISFRRRICGGGARYMELAADISIDNNIECLRSQLDAFDPDGRCEIESAVEETGVWDRVFLSERDMIFPIDNMKRAWSESCAVVTIMPGSHLPDFQYIINSAIRDKRLIASRFTTTQGTYDDNADVQHHAAHHLMQLVQDERLVDVLEVGSGSGILSRSIAGCYPDAKVTWIDLADKGPDGCVGTFIHGDAEGVVKKLPACSFDAVLSANAVQWIHSPMRFLSNVGRLLRDGGVAALSTFAPGTFGELSELNGDGGLPYLTADEWKKCVESTGLKVETAEQETIVLEFANGRDLARHLKKTGVNALTRTHGTSIEGIKHLLDSGRCHLTFNPLYLILRK